MYYRRCQQQKSALTCQPQQKHKVLRWAWGVPREMKHWWVWMTITIPLTSNTGSLACDQSQSPFQCSVLQEKVSILSNCRWEQRTEGESWEDDLSLCFLYEKVDIWSTPMRCHEMKDRLVKGQTVASWSRQGTP